MSACSGGGGGGGSVAGAAPPAPASQGGRAALNLHIPGSRSTSGRRDPAYVPKTAAGVGISVVAATASPSFANPQFVADLSPSAAKPVCTAHADGSRDCTLTVAAPAGSDVMAIAIYDAAPTNGGFGASAHILSEAIAPISVAGNATNQLSATLGGVPASVSLLPSKWVFNEARERFESTLAVMAYDASGTQIVPVAGESFATPITLAVSAGGVAFASGTGTQTTLTYTGPGGSNAGGTMTLTWDGTAFPNGGVTISASANGAAFASPLVMSDPRSSGTITAPSLGSAVLTAYDTGHQFDFEALNPNASAAQSSFDVYFNTPENNAVRGTNHSVVHSGGTPAGFGAFAGTGTSFVFAYQIESSRYNGGPCSGAGDCTALYPSYNYGPLVEIDTTSITGGHYADVHQMYTDLCDVQAFGVTSTGDAVLLGHGGCSTYQRYGGATGSAPSSPTIEYAPNSTLQATGSIGPTAWSTGLSDATTLTVGADDRLFVAHADGHVDIFSAKTITASGATQLGTITFNAAPIALAVSASGRLAALEQVTGGRYRIEFADNGGTTPAYAFDASAAGSPISAMTVDANDNVWLLGTVAGNPHVTVFDPGGGSTPLSIDALPTGATATGISAPRFTTPLTF